MTAATIPTVVRVAELLDTCSSRPDHDITTELVRLSAALLRRDVARQLASSRSADDRAGSAGGMRRIPGGWIMWHGDTSTYTKPLKGLVYLEHLIRRDGRAEHALDLVALTEGAAPADGPSRHQIGTDLGPTLVLMYAGRLSETATGRAVRTELPHRRFRAGLPPLYVPCAERKSSLTVL